MLLATEPSSLQPYEEIFKGAAQPTAQIQFLTLTGPGTAGRPVVGRSLVAPPEEAFLIPSQGLMQGLDDCPGPNKTKVILGF